MLGIILTVLKVTGIILLAIFGVILLIILIIFFVPVRYRVCADKKSQEGSPLYALAKANWLLHIITAEYEYKDNETELIIRIFGIRLRSREERDNRRLLKEKKKKEYKDKRSGIKQDETEYTMLEFDEQEGVISQKKVPSRGKTHVFIDEHEETSDTGDVIKEPSESVSDKGIDNNEADNAAKDIENTQKDKLYESLYQVFCKLSQKSKRIVLKAVRGFERILNKLTKAGQSAEYYYNALTNDKRNAEVLKLLLKKTKQLLKAIAPKKTKGHISCGFKDPADTGRFLAAAAVFYPLYGKDLTIEPYFDKKVLQFDLSLKGRIYIFTLVSILLQLYFNKNVKRFIHIMKKENTNG